MLLEDSVWIHERRWSSVKKYLENDTIVLVPVGATEQHGHHTPMMVDTGWAIAACEGVAKATGVLVAPPLHYGWSLHHFAYPGVIHFRPETLISALVDIGESLLYQGFNKIVFVNGNRVANLAPMDIAAAKLRFAHGAYVSVVDVGLIARKEVGEICVAGENGHAGDSETSFMRFWRPELVDMSQAVPGSGRKHEDGLPVNPQPMEPPFDINAVLVRPTVEEFGELSKPLGYSADPSQATEEKGRLIIEAIVRNFSKHIEAIRNKEVSATAIKVPV